MSGTSYLAGAKETGWMFPAAGQLVLIPGSWF